MILSDGADVRDLVPTDDRIRLIHLDENGSRLIGEKRNFGCERARGELIAHWDDDDYSAPLRLDDQVERLLSSGKSVTGYCSMRFCHGSSGRWWLYQGKASYALGTSLVYKRDWWLRNKFKAVQIGEDNSFIDQANAAGEFVSAPANGLMYATLHDGNTSPKLMGPRFTLEAA